MYKKLLISAGGGIISKDQQAEQNNTATIAIGLGGTGISCLRALKKEVYDRIKPDDPNVSIPTYKHIKFLAIDTDKAALADNGSIDTLDENTEFENIGTSNITALLENKTVLAGKPYLKWLKAKCLQDNGSGIDIENASAGAGGVRQIGRMLLIQNCERIVKKLTDIINAAKEDLGDGEISIHIFTGIGGGTGAGTFLDVCYLIQHVLKEIGIYGEAQVCGYFFLPDVNINKVSNTAVQKYIKSNGFAAMKELNYCMNFSTNGGEWNQEYVGFSVRTTEPPVRLAHLITATNSDGNTVSNAYNYAMHVVVDYVMDFIVKPFVSEKKDHDPFTIESHIANIQSIRNTTLKEHGAGYGYCVLGAANAYVPYKEITTYLTSKIFEGFTKIDHQLPGDNDIDLFIQTTGLKYEDLCKDLRREVPAVPIFEVDTKTIYEQTEGLTPDVIPQVLGQMRDSLSRIGGQVVENKRNMLQSLELINEDTQSGISSLISRTRKKIMEIAKQADKGPYYGGAILHSVKAKDLQNRIDGYIERNSRNLSNARADMSLRDQSMAQTLRNLQNSNALNRKTRGREYVQAVHAYFRQQADIEFYATLGDILSDFKRQVSDLYTQEFAIFENVLRQLESTFSANLEALSNPVAEENDYAIKLMTIKDLQESLDANVKEMKIDDLISGFIGHMLKTPDIWIAQDENKIAHAVSEYFLGELSEFTAKTMDDYLKIKFNTTVPGELKQKVREDIINKISKVASPLFWTNNTLYTKKPDTELGFLSIPQVSDVINGAAMDYNTANPNTKVRPSYCTDRISFLLFDCAVPMFAYKGVENYKSVPAVCGANLYEGAKNDDRDWSKLWNITPYSCLADPSDDVRALKAKVDAATEKGIFKTNTHDGATEFSLVEYDYTEIESLLSEKENVVKSDSEVKIQELIDAIEKAEPKVKGDHIIKNMHSGSDEVDFKCAIDIILESDKLMSVISEQLELVSEKEKVLSDLNIALESISYRKNFIKYFVGALCTGVIIKKNDFEYVYQKTSFGVSEDVSLTTINSEPYGADIPLYSAYLGFTQLDKEVIKEINQAIRDKRVNCADGVSVATDATKELVAEDKINKMVQRAQQSYGGALNDITAFLKSFAFEVNNF